MDDRLNIALAIPHGLSFIERAVVGISEFAQSRGGWSFTRMPEGLGTSIQWLRHWRGDGAFAMIVDADAVQLAKSLPFPVINLAGYLDNPDISTVCVDHEAIGRLGAEHLISKKFRRFGYYGSSRYWYSRLRLKGFRETVESVGGVCAVLDADSDADVPSHHDQQSQLKAWLSTLQMSVGIMASTDVRASIVLEACRQLRLRVPEDVAVLGVDNDPVFAELDNPPLTTISRNGRQVGLRAGARMLEMIQRPTSNHTIFVPPGEVIERGSTKTLAVDDPVISNMVQYVREHVRERFGVERLLGICSLSRRALEYRFRVELGTTPYDFINGQRIDAAKAIIKENPAAKTCAVANACGFADERRMRLVFKRITGITPTEYRRAVRKDSTVPLRAGLLAVRSGEWAGRFAI